ncbi:MAG: BolA family protein, partial [Gammaproteobacteria bacterium]|nr:BolA family protein [Gammaproteobacteria bacterium]
SHFKVIMVSSEFEGLPILKRHQLIYSILADEMRGIHALALHTLTAEEYEKRHGEIPASPLCLGGSKAS